MLMNIRIILTKIQCGANKFSFVFGPLIALVTKSSHKICELKHAYYTIEDQDQSVNYFS